MGVAIPVMHYTGMAAASFTPPRDGGHVPGGEHLAVGVVGITSVTLMVLAFVDSHSMIDRRFSSRPWS